MKIFKQMAALFLAFLLCLCGCETGGGGGEETPQNQEKTEEKTVLNYDNMKAMWLSQFDLSAIYRNGDRQRGKEDFSRRMDEVLDNVLTTGVNTVIVQVRPNGDSMYPSDVCPMSAYVVGAYGKEADYDAFSIILEKAHQRNLSVHAWINPMRCMSVEDIKKVPQRYEIRRFYEGKDTAGKYTVEVDGGVYLNPAYAETRGLIVRGVEELMDRYHVDGIHMDDYFYPTTAASFDTAAYADYREAGGKLDLADFRRKNVNTMVREIYAAVKAKNPDMPFGISPAGVMKNNYNKLYADVATWCGHEGYIDYICPQVYFGFEHETVPFAATCKAFADMIQVKSIRLYIGISLGKSTTGEDKWAGSGKNEWKEHKDVLRRQLEYLLDMPQCHGVCYFCYQYFFNPQTGAKNPKGREEKENLLPLLRTCVFS